MGMQGPPQQNPRPRRPFRRPGGGAPAPQEPGPTGPPKPAPKPAPKADPPPAAPIGPAPPAAKTPAAAPKTESKGAAK